MKSLSKLSTVLFLIFCFGCAGLQIKLDTTEKKYLASRAELNLLLEQYIMVQDRFSDEDHLKAKTAFHAADAALDAWEAMLKKPDYDYGPNLMVWLETKRIIIQLLRGFDDG